MLLKTTKAKLFAFSAFLATTAPAVASVLRPVNGNSWDIYVFGNSSVIYGLLSSAKLMVNPTLGGSGFSFLMLAIAILSFVALAIAAMFDPGKNLLKLGKYIFVCWGVTFAAQSLKMNVTINEMVPTPQTPPSIVVTDVPAIVAMPAFLTSMIGKYFTESIESYYSSVSPMAKTTGLQFNLFNKIRDDANYIQFSDPGLKNSFMAYIADCTIPAIATGRLHGVTKNPLTGEIKDISGGTALIQSANMMDTLQSAAHNAIMTKSFPSALSDTNSLTQTSAMGVVVSCADAYDNIKNMAAKEAQMLVDASSTAFAKSGVLVPYETLMSDMLAQASAPGSASNIYSRPSGYIMQQALLNTMSGGFRTAALQTGNNELMTAAALSQAEQNQTSAWVSGAMTFNNMMGPVFSVLQSLMFGMTPIIIVAILIPGLGKTIFVNYTQILIWLALWMPMLSIVNYIIVLFSQDGFSQNMLISNGVSMANQALERKDTRNYIVTAQFLGTLVPMITWGIVKGAMAFTDFISHAVGNQFASTAGQTAANGNLSMGNLSLDNTSANKYNTAMASTIGTQETQTYLNAGSATALSSQGGSGVSANGSMVEAKKAFNEGITSMLQRSTALSDVLSTASSRGWSERETMDYAKSKGGASLVAEVSQLLANFGFSSSKGEGSSDGKNVTRGVSQATNAAQTLQAGKGVSTSAAVQTSFKAGGLPGKLVEAVTGAGLDVKLAATTERQEQTSNTLGTTQGTDEKAQRTSNIERDKLSTSESSGASQAGSFTTTNNDTLTESKSAGKSKDISFSEAVQKAASRQQAVTESLAKTASIASSFGISQGLDLNSYRQQLNAMNSLANDYTLDAKKIRDEFNQMNNQLTGGVTEIEQHRDKAGNEIKAQRNSIPSAAPASQNSYSATLKNAQKDHKDRKESITRNGEQINQDSNTIERDVLKKQKPVSMLNIEDPKPDTTRHFPKPITQAPQKK